MNSPATGLRIAGTLFAFFALVHVWRLVRGFQVIIGSYHLAPEVSLVGAIFGAVLSVWMWKLAANPRP